ncbi:MAG: beta-galactosidase trimerization domain-containing protein, partial [Lentisphaeria bacterium]|nr:beta-galactosidase trimerization domain-containing protein [Lentisphaeria bacterium]
NELRGGIDRMILNAKEVGRDIAVLYSQSSLFAAMGGIGAGTWHNSQTGWAALLEDLKLNYFYLPYDVLDKEVPKAKVVVLPAAISLSDKAVANLQKFVAAGGTVVADFAPGWFNEHGLKVRSAGVEKLFGISRAASTLAVSGTVLQSKAHGSIPAVSGEFRIGENKLAASNAVSLGGGKAFFVNRCGKGQAILLNVLLSGYQDISLGGVGGEEFSVKSGAALFCDNMRKLMGGIFAEAKVSRTSIVTETGSGKLYPCATMLRQDGENYVFGILKHQRTAPDGKFPMRFDKKFAKALTVKLAVKGHIYDVRKGKYLGYNDTIKVNLIPGDGQVFAIQSKKAAGVQLAVPGTVFRGREIEARFNVKGSAGAQIFRLELIAPDGKIAKVYSRTGRFPANSGSMKFQLAHNDNSGVWKCRIIHVNSGLYAEKNMTVK